MTEKPAPDSGVSSHPSPVLIFGDNLDPVKGNRSGPSHDRRLVEAAKKKRTESNDQLAYLSPHRPVLERNWSWSAAAFRSPS